ncbi:uncharacterized protein LOC135130947 [Zophobas morio]|uniref:uncharacterized protein LOC135130947 n=1 Tax=Zophobas morio TaxID=2755281 RepID=UPI003083A1FB
MSTRRFQGKNGPNHYYHNLLDQNDPSCVFKKRTGTTDDGGLFEEVYVAHLLLNLINNDKITKFNVWSNHPHFGAMDDVVFDVYSNDVNLKGTYAVQLKYATAGGILTKQALVAKKGDFSVMKYFQEYRQKTTTVGTFKFILVTNRKFDIDDKELVMENDNVKFNVSIKKIKKKKKHFRFEIVDTNATAIQDYEHFFKNFTLITNCDSIDEINKNIREIFISRFSCQDELIFKRYIEFVGNWSKNMSQKTTLHSSFAKHVIALLILSPTRFLSFDQEPEGKKFKLLRKAISKFDVICLSSDAYPKVKNWWYGLKERQSVNNLEYLKRARQYQIFGSRVKSLKDLNDEEWTKFLWLLGKCPLVVEDSEATRKAIGLCERKKFIVFNVKSVVSYSVFRPFRSLLNLKKWKILYKRILSTFTCSIQGKREIRLEDLIDKREKIVAILDADKLVAMVDEALLIGQPEDLPPSPISRFLSRNMIKYKFLDKIDLQKNLVVVSCVSSVTTFKKQFPHVEAIDVDEFLTDANSGTKQDEFVVLSENDISKEEFATICKKVPRGRRCYHLRYFSSTDGFEWVRSSTKNQNLTQFLLSGTFIEESELTRSEDDNINLVCADPGIGKTTLAKTLKNISAPTTWSVLIYVRDHSKYFREKGDNVDNFKTYIANTIKTQNSRFDFQVVEALFAEGRVKYFWDGLDELSDNGFRTVKSIIKELSKADYSQHWITCRSLLREDLENYFHVLSRTLKEFDEDDQKTYLKNRLECSDQELDEIFVKIRNNIRLFPHNDILGIPLQIYILSELLLRDRLRYSRLLDEIFSIADLYERFVEEKFNFHFREKEGIENMEDVNDLVYERITKEKNNQLSYYKESALRLYFDETVLQKLEIKRELVADKDPAGFITDVSDKAEFFHNSFGEYFAAAYLAQHREKLLHIQNFTFDSKYNNIRFFFDLILAKKSPIHVAVLYKNHHLVESFQDGEFRKVDEGGRSVLEVACLWCEKYPVVNVQAKENIFVVKKPPHFRNMKPEPEINGKILVLLLQKYEEEEIQRVLHQESLFHESNFIRVLPLILLTKKTNKRTDFFAENIFTVLQYCVLFDYEDLIDTCQEIWQMRDSSGSSIIHQIVQYKSIKVMKALAAKKKDEKFLAKNEENLLQLACVNGDYEMVDFLIQHGANLNSVDSNKKTPIHHACFGGDYAICRLLLKHGAHLHFETAFSKTLLHHCCSKGIFEMVQLLIEYRAPVNFVDTYGRTPLHLACAYGHYAIAEYLTTFDITIDVEDLDGKTPLYNAALSKHDKICELLLERGAYLDYVNRKGLMYIHMACKWGHKSVVNVLIEKLTPAVLNCRDSEGLTSVHHCCINRLSSILALVIANGADVNLVDTTYGRTPLHYVCRKSTHYEIVVMLLENGAALERTDNTGATPLYRACCSLNDHIVQLLVQKGANCNACTNEGKTPLHHASGQGLDWIIKLLIENGAEINLPDKSARTPLNYAFAKDHYDAMEILTRHGAKFYGYTN